MSAPTRGTQPDFTTVLPDQAHRCNSQRLTPPPVQQEPVALLFLVVAFFVVATGNSPSRFKHTFFQQEPVASISCCCIQHRGVFFKTRDTSVHRQQQHNHTNISSHSLWPRPTPPLPTAASTDRRAHCGYAHFTSYVAILKDSKVVSSKRMSERICEHVVDVSVPQVVEQLFVVPKISSQTESCSVPWNRFLAVPATVVVKKLVEVPKFVSQDRILQRTLEQISDQSSSLISPWVGFNIFLWNRFSEFPQFQPLRSSLISPSTGLNRITKSRLSKLAPFHGDPRGANIQKRERSSRSCITLQVANTRSSRSEHGQRIAQ